MHQELHLVKSCITKSRVIVEPDRLGLEQSIERGSIVRRSNIAITLGIAALMSLPALGVPIVLSKLSGATIGGSPAGTAVYKADLTAIGGSIDGVTIRDNSSGLGGATGVFSGFDLDAILLSSTNCATTACAAGLTGLSLFDFSTAGTSFTPGSQRAPAGPKLFGTDATGANVDNSVATLGSFDANSTTGTTAFGFLSMGDNGVLSFDLLSAISTAGLFLYIGEVGDNGEVAAGSIEVTRVPEPGTLGLLGLGLLGLGLIQRKRRI